MMPKKNLLQLFLLLTVAFLLCFVPQNMPILLYKTVKVNPIFENKNIMYPFGQIYTENVLIQKIRLDSQQTIQAIDLNLATYARKNTNTNEITISKNAQIVDQKKIKSRFLKDNAFYRISHLNIPVNAGDEITIAISSADGRPGNSITAWISDQETNNPLFQYQQSTGAYTKKSGELSTRILVRGNIFQNLSEKYLHIPVFWLYLLYGFLCLLILFVFRKIFFDDMSEEDSQ